MLFFEEKKTFIIIFFMRFCKFKKKNFIKLFFFGFMDG